MLTGPYALVRRTGHWAGQHHGGLLLRLAAHQCAADRAALGGVEARRTADDAGGRGAPRRETRRSFRGRIDS